LEKLPTLYGIDLVVDAATSFALFRSGARDTREALNVILAVKRWHPVCPSVFAGPENGIPE